MFKILSYPPTLEQLRILEMLGQRGDLSLVLLRVATFVLLLVLVWLWVKMVSRYYGETVSKWSGMLAIITPAYFIFGLCYPLFVLKIFLVVLVFYCFKRINWWLMALLLIGIIFYNVLALNNKPAIFNKLSFKDAQTEVNNRFTSEDSLKTKTVLPLWWRRIAYNKYFFTYKQIVAEVLPAFDLESLFFQEVHPMGQKSVVMFYWPEILLLVLGIYYFGKRDGKKFYFVGNMLILGLVNFVFSEGSSFIRLGMLIMPISVILAYGIIIIEKQRWLLTAAGVILVYSFCLNSYDLNVRTDYWLDNRPMAYQFWFQNLAKLNIDNFEVVQVTSIIGDSNKYCNFYLGKVCDQKKFVFEGFDLATNNKINRGVYAGFGGEFIGPKFKNDVAGNWVEIAKSMGLREIKTVKLLDTIAYKYGNDISLMVKD